MKPGNIIFSERTGYTGLVVKETLLTMDIRWLHCSKGTGNNYHIGATTHVRKDHLFMSEYKVVA